MDAKGGPFSYWWAVGRLLWAAALTVCVAGAGFCWWSAAIDEAAIQTLARSVTRHEVKPDDKALALMRFVHHIGATSRNAGTFGPLRWRATGLQVAASGGDCADKSRLLVALLTAVDLCATPVLCFDAENGAPAHTIVEAELAPGSFMVLDPAFDLWFPKSGGGYHGLRDLRDDPAIVPKRVAELQLGSGGGGAADPYYLRAGADYATASTFNWNRGPIARATAFMLYSILGDELYRVYRPRWLEEPKHKAYLVCLIAAGFLAIMPLMLRIVCSRGETSGRRKPADSPSLADCARAVVVG